MTFPARRFLHILYALLAAVLLSALPLSSHADQSMTMDTQKLSSPELTALYLTGITRGHLLAAMELASLGRYDEAIVHSRHPIDEILNNLKPVVAADQLSRLRAIYEPFNEAMALKVSPDALKTLYEPVLSRISEVEDSVKQTPVPPLQENLNLICLWMKQAVEENIDAWKDGRLVDIIEYQDGYGYLKVAKAKLNEIAADLHASNPAAAEELEKAVNRLQIAWPAVIPPQSPTLGNATLKAQIAIFEINARSVR